MLRKGVRGLWRAGILSTKRHARCLGEQSALTERVCSRHLELQEPRLLGSNERLELLLWLLLLLRLQTKRICPTHGHRSLLWHQETSRLYLHLRLAKRLSAKHGTRHHLLLVKRILHGLILEIGCCWTIGALALAKREHCTLNSPVRLRVEHRMLFCLDSTEKIHHGLLPLRFRR